MPLSRLIRTITMGLLVITCSMPVAAITLESLPESSQEDIAKLCLPVQFKEGAAAYRNCVQSELDIRSDTAAKNNQLTNLSFDDRYAVQQACAKAGAESSTTYDTCVTEQISALQKIAAPQLDKFSEDELDAIQQACFDAQSRLGAAAFRQCLNAEVSSLNDIPKVNLSSLTALEKNALQLRCSAIASTAAAYRGCLGDEHLLITGKPPVFTASNNSIATSRSRSTANPTAAKSTATAVKPAVSQADSTSSAKAASQEQITSTEKPVTKKPEVSIATLEAPISPNIDTATSRAGHVVAALPRNIAPQRATDGLDTSTDSSTNIEPPVLTPVTNNEPRVISKPGLVQELQAANNTALANATPAEENTTSDTSTTVTSIQAITETAVQPSTEAPFAEKMLALWQGFLQKIGTLSSTGWLVLAAILILPAILLGLFSIIRKNKRNAYQAMPRPSLSDRIGPELQSRKLRQEKEAAELFGGDDNNSPNMDIDSNAETTPAKNTTNDSVSADDSLDTLEITNSELTSVEQSMFSRADLTQDPFDFETADDEKPAQLPSNFQAWLYQKPKNTHLKFCIDFLIYWMAYGDERYDPKLKQRIFKATRLSDNDLIKRWVLQNDTHAFAETIAWMRKNASQPQLEETIALLMALLVSENNVTPVQNTLLRFLADAFNMGEQALQEQFEAAFAHELPPMPRPDREPWWQKQDDNIIKSWNSRQIAELPENEKLLVRLGLTSEYNDSDIIQSFRRAAHRCHPDRFPNLSERERAMAEHRFKKFEEARDKLLGVSV